VQVKLAKAEAAAADRKLREEQVHIPETGSILNN